MLRLRAPMLMTALLLLAFLSNSQSQEAQLPWKDPALPLAQRVDDLVSRMTLEEKVSQMMDQAPAINRLGVPAYAWWNEALHGVARSGNATVFPQAIGLAATWNTTLMRQVADVISTEARAKYHEAIRQGHRARYFGLTFWSPNINIFRDPRWGRGQETYGEDPFLTARMGVAFVAGLQGDDPRYLKTVSTPKHYAVHSGPEPLRHQFDVKISLREMQDTYFPAFRATVAEAKAWSVMCAYNSDNGQPACANDYLLKDMLRGAWGFQGYVVSDCGAVDDIHQGHKYRETLEKASAIAVQTGTDLDCGDEYKSLVKAVKEGFISEAEIDVAVKRLMEARFRLGMFDPPELVPYANIPFAVNDSAAHRQMALRAARESIVLLKNDNFLPFGKKIKKIAVIGPNADSLDVLLGNYNGMPSAYTTPLQGIRKRFANATVTYAVGAPLNPEPGVPVPAAALRPSRKDKANGLKAEYFGNVELQGAPRLTRVDRQVNFEGEAPGDTPQGFTGENFSVRWTGVLVPPASGKYQLGIISDDGFRLYLDGKLLVEDWTHHAARPLMAPVALEKHRKYEIKIEYFQGVGGAAAKLVWLAPFRPVAYDKEAVKLAKKADVVVMVLGISPRLEGEEMDVKMDGFSGGDRTSIDLPAAQEKLLQAVQATGKPVVVVLLSGSALAVNWAQQHAKAILEAWYPGEEGGTAIAEVLAGDYNPAGRLPVTFYKSVDQLPPFTEYAMAGRTYRYFSGEPLYPFGFGLSYSTFAYTDLKIEPRASGAVVTAAVQNTSSRAGDEVVQLYVTDLTSSGPKPIRALAGFQRIHLDPGQRQQVTFTLGPRELSLVNEQGKRIFQGGRFAVSVGGRQPDAHPSTSGYVAGEFTASGKTLELD
jgi:beta-glucosidase